MCTKTPLDCLDGTVGHMKNRNLIFVKKKNFYVSKGKKGDPIYNIFILKLLQPSWSFFFNFYDQRVTPPYASSVRWFSC